MVQRKKCHKNTCNNPNGKGYNSKIYRTIRDNGGWDAFRMVPLEKMENTTKFEAECREEVVRTDLQAKMNSQKATRGNITRKEYFKIYTEEHKDHKKLYYEERKDRLNEKQKNYYQENREQIRTKANENFDCQCGSKYNRSCKAQHFKTKIHQKYLNSLKNET
jgi:hypothetical protein